MNHDKKISKRCSILLLAISLVLTMFLGTVPALAEASEENGNHFNMMLVIDGSGSLISKNSGTDKAGLRYDAINLFLALLTNKGNNVGAIVFDSDPQNYLLNSGLLPITGKTDKVDLSQKIRDAGTRADTDIGSALLTAVDTLKAQQGQNGNQSAIILFSDGRTALSTDEEYQQSIENKETAIAEAQEAGIPIYSVCLAATDVADPDELQQISNRTSGQAVVVNNAEDLSSAFETFYNLIFPAAGSETKDVTFPESGVIESEIQVPSYGAEEVNVILKGNSYDSIEMQSPSATVSAAELDDWTMEGGDYQVIKVEAPEPGTWILRLHGNPGAQVRVNVIYNVDSSAKLSTADGQTDYATGGTVTLQASLYKNGSQVQDVKVAEEYTATLTLTNLADGTTSIETMQPTGNGQFTYDLTGTDYGTIQAAAELVFGDLRMNTNTIDLNFGNTAPTVAEENKEKTEKVIVTPITGHKRSYDLNEFFNDAQGDTLDYTIVSSQLVNGTAAIENGKLNVQTAKSRSGDLVVRAADSQGAYNEMTFHFKVTNLSVPIYVVVAGIILLVIVLTALARLAARPSFKGTFYVANVNDPEDYEGKARGSFKGKLALAALHVGGCGFDPKKSYFQATRGGGLEFSPPKGKKAYVEGMECSKVTIMGETIIYANEEETNGIRVSIMEQEY